MRTPGIDTSIALRAVAAGSSSNAIPHFAMSVYVMGGRGIVQLLKGRIHLAQLISSIVYDD
jgi:hypothetical protein